MAGSASSGRLGRCVVSWMPHFSAVCKLKRSAPLTKGAITAMLPGDTFFGNQPVDLLGCPAQHLRVEAKRTGTSKGESAKRNSWKAGDWIGSPMTWSSCRSVWAPPARVRRGLMAPATWGTRLATAGDIMNGFRQANALVAFCSQTGSALRIRTQKSPIAGSSSLTISALSGAAPRSSSHWRTSMWALGVSSSALSKTRWRCERNRCVRLQSFVITWRLKSVTCRLKSSSVSRRHRARKASLMRSAAARALRRAVRCSESGTANPGGDRLVYFHVQQGGLVQIVEHLGDHTAAVEAQRIKLTLVDGRIHKLGHVKLARFKAQKVGSRVGSSKPAVAASSGQ